MPRVFEILRFSLGEILLVALATSLGMAALRTGGLFAAAYLFGAVVLSAIVLVTAIVGRGAPQAFAVGCLIGVSVYGGVLYWYGDEEFDPDRGELLTTRGAKPVFNAIRDLYYVDAFSGREATPDESRTISGYEFVPISHWDRNLKDVPFGDASRVASPRDIYWSIGVRPASRDFMQVFHLLAALTLGYGAGKLGAGLYRRRQPLPTDSVAEAGSPRDASSSLAPGGGTGSRR